MMESWCEKHSAIRGIADENTVAASRRKRDKIRFGARARRTKGIAKESSHPDGCLRVCCARASARVQGFGAASSRQGVTVATILNEPLRTDTPPLTADWSTAPGATKARAGEKEGEGARVRLHSVQR